MFSQLFRLFGGIVRYRFSGGGVNWWEIVTLGIFLLLTAEIGALLVLAALWWKLRK